MCWRRANSYFFGRDWITTQIRERLRLRMMVPRVYGLGDLFQIIDERASLQARYIISAMGDDLRCFVTTDAHRRSVEALTRHGFVLLLGIPHRENQRSVQHWQSERWTMVRLEPSENVRRHQPISNATGIRDRAQSVFLGR